MSRVGVQLGPLSTDLMRPIQTRPDRGAAGASFSGGSGVSTGSGQDQTMSNAALVSGVHHDGSSYSVSSATCVNVDGPGRCQRTFAQRAFEALIAMATTEVGESSRRARFD